MGDLNKIVEGLVLEGSEWVVPLYGAAVTNNTKGDLHFRVIGVVDGSVIIKGNPLLIPQGSTDTPLLPSAFGELNSLGIGVLGDAGGIASVGLLGWEEPSCSPRSPIVVDEGVSLILTPSMYEFLSAADAQATKRALVVPEEIFVCNQNALRRGRGAVRLSYTSIWDGSLFGLRGATWSSISIQFDVPGGVLRNETQVWRMGKVVGLDLLFDQVAESTGSARHLRQTGTGVGIPGQTYRLTTRYIYNNQIWFVGEDRVTIGVHPG